jgi:glycosyltransferase involved in cell wall biosynthesis
MAQRLEPEKDADVAIAAFACSGLHRQGWTLEVAGDGALRGRLHRQVHALGLGHAVRFLGRRSDVQELMDTAAILLAPGPHESFGLSVLEAMASGLPTVAAAAGGHLETIGSLVDARLFPPGDAATAGLLLAGLADDPGARDVYARSLQDAQRTRFTIEAQARGTEVVYRSVL